MKKVNDLGDPSVANTFKDLFGNGTYSIQSNGTILITNGRNTLRITPGQIDDVGNMRAHMHRGNLAGHADDVFFPPGTTWLDVLDAVTSP